MIMDKGLSIREVEDMIDISGDFIDIVKLGWATSYVTKNLKEKLAVYKSAGLPVSPWRDPLKPLLSEISSQTTKKCWISLVLEYAEVSDGSM